MEGSRNVDAHGDGVAEIVQGLDVGECLDPAPGADLVSPLLENVVVLNPLARGVLVVRNRKHLLDVRSDGSPHGQHVLGVGVVLVLLALEAGSRVGESSVVEVVGHIAADVVEALKVGTDELVQLLFLEADQLLDELRHKCLSRSRVEGKRLVPVRLQKLVDNVRHGDGTVGAHDQGLLDQMSTSQMHTDLVAEPV